MAQPSTESPDNETPRTENDAKSRRIGVRDVGAVLTVVTCLMVVVGFAAVHHLAGGRESTPALKIPPNVPQTNPEALPASPIELRPQVLKPQTAEASPTPLPLTTPTTNPHAGDDNWHNMAPIPLAPRTAVREEGSHYR